MLVRSVRARGRLRERGAIGLGDIRGVGWQSQSAEGVSRVNSLYRDSRQPHANTAKHTLESPALLCVY